MLFNRALVLFSGGQDSTTCLAWALDRYAHVETIGFDYGQKHHVELNARQVVLQSIKNKFPAWAARLGADHMIDLGALGKISDTALTRDSAIKMTVAGLPNTFVPGRNLLFLTLAASVGYRRDLSVMVGGMCETDFSGYPDCRDDTIKAQQVAVSLGMGQRFTFETPLMWIDKAETWALAHRLGGDALTKIILEDSHTCYHGVRERMHSWGYGCGECPACELRKAGYQRWVESVAA
ncbi:MAG: 7-cyano-7-deazaguanine synthase QueC [Rhodoferax sp.]|nr:7-cyano-7-deazaguanine synthase QueC [Rhodoferax sp.]MDP3651675.1 7-cyano-7-deazaguanine synthase QueC [Rhodoferax sp.]